MMTPVRARALKLIRAARADGLEPLGLIVGGTYADELRAEWLAQGLISDPPDARGTPPLYGMSVTFVEATVLAVRTVTPEVRN